MSADWEAGRQWRMRCQTQWGAPKTIDLWDFVHNKRELTGVVSISAFDRLLEELADQPIVRSLDGLRDDEMGVVWFEITGHAQVGERARLNLKVQARMGLVCQRCLSDMCLDVSEQVAFDVVTQAQLEQMDHEEIDPDETEMLVGSRQFDLPDLLEDQLILAVPYVPKHEQCEAQHALGQEAFPEDEEVDSASGKPNPFEVLGQLKREK